MPDSKSRIIALLKSYPSMKRQIEQLRFEAEHPSLINDKELIESLALAGAKLGEVGAPSSQPSNRTMAIAMRYQDIKQNMNSSITTEIMAELRLLETEVKRLEHYTSLLPPLRASVIRLMYFEQKSWAETEAEINLSKTSITNLRKEAVKELVSMYSYIGGLKETADDDTG
jgi:DNA-directed RNA polymerase specialized sigma subunit